MILMVFGPYLGAWTLRVGCASGCMVVARRGSIRPSPCLLSTGMYGCNGHRVFSASDNGWEHTSPFQCVKCCF